MKNLFVLSLMMTSLTFANETATPVQEDAEEVAVIVLPEEGEMAQTDVEEDQIPS